jgi:hypothetical protein
LALELKELPVVPAVLPPAELLPDLDSESHRVVDQGVLKLDINTSTGSGPLRRVLKRLGVVVVAFGRGTVAAGYVAAI